MPNAYDVDVDTALRDLVLIGPLRYADLSGVLSAPPRISRTIDGASTVTVTVTDARRTLIQLAVINQRSFAVVDRAHFELVKVAKAGDELTLTFEDAIVAALRRRTDPRTFAAGTATRATIARALCAEAQIRVDVDPAAREPVAEAVERSTAETQTDSWKLLGELAENIGWRRFSDGAGIIFGSDAWLMSRYPPVSVREHTGGVHDIDWDLDTGQPAAEATLHVDADSWSLPPGLAVDVVGQGPASGRWLIASYDRELTRTRAEIGLVRERPSLMEPPPSAEAAATGDQGQVDFLPYANGAPAGRPTTGRGASGEGYLDAAARQSRANGTAGGRPSSVRAADAGPREQMLSYALAQQGKPYVWGASGPNSFDCSGLVQCATRAGGRELAKPSASQWSTVRSQGRVISVDEALKTRGALLFRVGTGANHVAISLGDGRTVEARGTAYGTGVFPADRASSYTGGGIWL